MTRLLACMLACAGCVPLGSFECTEAGQCDPNGTCEPEGWCSFPAEECASGRRFSRYATEALAGRCVELGDAAWWDRAWTRRHRLSFDDGPREGALTGFPVLVVLDPTRFDYAAAAPGGADLRFVDDDGETLLPYEIERWDPVGTSLLWVYVPRIDPEEGDFVDLYFGNASATAEDFGSPWTEGFVGVWHLGDDLQDATRRGNDGTATGTSIAPGIVDAANRFAGADDAISVGAAADLADIFDAGGSASAWVFADSFRDVYPRILDKSSDLSSSDGWALLLADDGESISTLRFARGFSVAHAGWSGPAGAIALGRWHHVAVVYDASVASNVPALYVDGVAVEATTTNAGQGEPQSDRDRPLVIGNLGATFESSVAFDGVLDEVRVATTLRTPDWIAAEHLVGLDAFVTYGPEETAP